MEVGIGRNMNYSTKNPPSKYITERINNNVIFVIIVKLNLRYRLQYLIGKPVSHRTQDIILTLITYIFHVYLTS